MHDAVVTNGALKLGQSILVQGASSGVGLMGMQVAKAMGAALVLGSSSNADRRARLAEFGCDVAVDTGDAGWSDRVLEATDGRGVDVIVGQVSASVAYDNLRACAILGRIVNVGRLGGAKGEFDFDLHAKRQVREISHRMRAGLWPVVESGQLRLPLDRTFPLADAAAALAHMKSSAHFGKIVLECRDPALR